MADLSPLQRLAQEHRVGTTFRGWDGSEQTVSDQTLTAVLSALGVPCENDDDVIASLRAAELAPWLRELPPAVVVRVGKPATVPLNVPSGREPRATVELEDGTERVLEPVAEETRVVDGQSMSRFSVDVPPDLPLGWHSLVVDGGARCALVVTPQKLSTGDRLTRTWGLMAQLYSVRSRSSWGVGDLADLSQLSVIAAEKGAGFILINPLHAAQPKPPVEASPYLPSTRRFFNPLYLRVEDVPEAAGLANIIRDLAAGFADANQNSDVIDRDPSYAAKLEALGQVFEVPRTAEREAAFTRFRHESGPG